MWLRCVANVIQAKQYQFDFKWNSSSMEYFDLLKIESHWPWAMDMDFSRVSSFIGRVKCVLEVAIWANRYEFNQFY